MEAAEQTEGSAPKRGRGRPVGSKSGTGKSRTTEGMPPFRAPTTNQARIAITGYAPLDIMLHTMRAYWDEAEKEAFTILPENATPADIAAAEELAAQRKRALRMAAVEVAAKAAPYIHPRLQTLTVNANVKSEVNVTQQLASFSDAELAALAAMRERLSTQKEQKSNPTMLQ